VTSLRIGLLTLALAVPACGSTSATPTVVRGSGATNGGVIVISQAATYAYTLTGGCPDATSLGAIGFRIVSDGGQVDWLRASGTIYLTPGNWSGQDGEQTIADPAINLPSTFAPNPCYSWVMTLTPTS
jgi:hypothetical protein